jgi:hypothetical protein
MLATNCTGSLQQLLLQMPHWRAITAPGSHKVLSAIANCHTAHFGYHAYRSAPIVLVGLYNTYIIVAGIGIVLGVAILKKKSG